MDAQQEQKVMQSFYDRIFEMITYSPASKSGGLDPHTTLIQLVNNRPIELSSYKKMASPSNTNTANLADSQAFFELTDQIGSMEVDWHGSGKSVSDLYGLIINNADTSVAVSKEQKKLYSEAYSYLNTTIKMKGFTGKTVTSTAPSKIFSTYQTNQAAYTAAVSAYALKYHQYDLSKISDQQKWMAEAPILKQAINTAWQNWVVGGKAAVEQALDVLQSTDHNYVAAVIAQAQETFKDGALPSLTSSKNDWYLTYAQPAKWWDSTQSDLWIDFSLNSNYLYTSSSSYYEKSEGSAGSSFLGLISWGGSGGSSTKSTSYHMQGNNLSITAKMMTVNFVRPWFSTALFGTSGWFLSGQQKDYISNGLIANSNACKDMPMIPVSMVLVKDVSITANWSSKDTATLQKHSSGGGGFSFGPFHAGGSGGSSSSSSSATSSFSGGTLTFDGVQMVAMVNAITHASPPQAG